MRGYDKISENADMLLDLPFYEGVGAITRDQAKPHHQDVILANVPTWDSVASGLGVLTFDGLADYFYLDDAACVDLDFIAGDYSLGCWLNWTDNALSQIVIARYQLDHSGWELYLTKVGAPEYLTLRHHHAGTLVPPVTGNPRSGCYSIGWTPGIWWFMGLSRTGGGEAQHYQNGVALTMSTSGLVDPETCSRDLVGGIRFTKDANYYKGSMWRPRIWNRALTAAEWLTIFEAERDWFGV